MLSFEKIALYRKGRSCFRHPIDGLEWKKFVFKLHSNNFYSYCLMKLSSRYHFVLVIEKRLQTNSFCHGFHYTKSTQGCIGGFFLSANEGCAGFVSGACLWQCLLEYKDLPNSSMKLSIAALTSKPGKSNSPWVPSRFS